MTDHPRRKAAAAPENLRQCGVVGTDVPRERAQRITRIAPGAAAKFQFQRGSKMHGLTIERVSRRVNGVTGESGANPSRWNKKTVLVLAGGEIGITETVTVRLATGLAHIADAPGLPWWQLIEFPPAAQDNG